MPVTRPQKEEILKKLKKNMEKAKIAVFVKYSGLKVKDAEKVRKGLRAENFTCQVAKKTLIQKVASEFGYKEIPNEIFEGPIAVAFGYEDEVGPAKKLYGYCREYENMKLMGGLSEGKILTTQEIKELALIPSKLELLAKFMSMIQSPLYSFAGMLNSPLSSFARGIKAMAEKKENK